jgi:hypothetical protein
MANSLRFLPLMAAGMILAACGQPSTPSAPALAAAPPRAAQSDDRIGIPECDDYLDRYDACLSSHVPEGARAALRTALQQSRANWRKAVANNVDKAALTAACRNARAAARPSLVARGCADF